MAPDGNQVNEKQHEGDLAPESGAPEAEKELEDEDQDREPPRPRAHSPQPEPRDEHEGSPHHDGRAEGRAHEDATSTREQAADEAQADGKDDPGDYHQRASDDEEDGEDRNEDRPVKRARGLRQGGGVPIVRARREHRPSRLLDFALALRGEAGESLPRIAPATFKSPLPVPFSHKREPLPTFGENTRA